MEVTLRNGRTAQIDEEDLPLFDSLTWTTIRGRYVVHYYRPGHSPRSVLFHRLLMNPPDGLEVDHINGDGLDNRKANLRLVTRSQQMQNLGVRKDSTTGYRGVEKKRNRFRAYCRVDKRTYQFGWFATPEEAARAAAEGRRRLMTHSSRETNPA